MLFAITKFYFKYIFLCLINCSKENKKKKYLSERSLLEICKEFARDNIIFYVDKLFIFNVFLIRFYLFVFLKEIEKAVPNLTHLF